MMSPALRVHARNKIAAGLHEMRMAADLGQANVRGMARAITVEQARLDALDLPPTVAKAALRLWLLRWGVEASTRTTLAALQAGIGYCRHPDLTTMAADLGMTGMLAEAEAGLRATVEDYRTLLLVLALEVGGG